MKIDVEQLNELLITNDSHMEMSSREIAKLFGKTHRHVIRDMKVQYIHIYGDDFIAVNCPPESITKPAEYIYQNLDMIFKSITSEKEIDRKRAMIKINGLRILFDARGLIGEIFIDADFANALFCGYDKKTAFAIVKRWRELEQGLATPAWEKLEGKAYTDYVRKMMDRIDQEREEKEKAHAKSWFHSREALAQKLRSKEIVSSKDIAELFGVRHDHVMRAIESWAASKSKARKARAQYTTIMCDNGRQRREILLTQPYADNFVSEYRPFKVYGDNIQALEREQMLNAPEEMPYLTQDTDMDMEEQE